MRYLLAVIPFAAVATLSAQTADDAHPAAQAPPPPPPWDAPHLEFDVASVKTNKSGPNMMSMRTLPTSFNVTNLPLRLLITQAYRVSGYQLVGGPSWLDSERFDIVAKAPEGSRPDQTMLMLRGLLAERFKLKVHGETRETQIYALVLARSDGKLGPKLSKSTDDCEKILAERRAAAAAARAGGARAGSVHPFLQGSCRRPASAHLHVSMRRPPPQGLPLFSIPRRGPADAGPGESDLSGQSIDTSSIARVSRACTTSSCSSRCRGRCRSPRRLRPATPPAAPIDDGPTMFDAVRELGLKLESERGPVEHLVIDSVEKPTED